MQIDRRMVYSINHLSSNIRSNGNNRRAVIQSMIKCGSANRRDETSSYWLPAARNKLRHHPDGYDTLL